MKRKPLVIAVFLGATLLLGILVLSYFARKNPSVASAGELPKNLFTPTPYATTMPGVSAQILEKFAHSNIVTQVNAGVEISAANFRVEKNEVNNFDELKIDVCFQKPDGRDWGIREAIVQIGDVKIPADGIITVEMTSTLQNGQRRITTFLGDPPQINTRALTSDNLPDYRCDSLYFRLTTEMSSSDVFLIVKSIVAIPSEGEGCETLFENVQSILDAENTGIRIDCVKQDYGEFTSIAEKPETMSEEEAQRLINEARRRITTIEGPWIFTGRIE